MLGRFKILGKETIFYGLGSALNKFFGLILLPFFTSYLTPKDYGVLSMLALMGFIIQQLFSCGVNAGLGITYFSEKEISMKEKVIKGGLLIIIVSSLTLIGLSVFFAKQISFLLFNDYQYSKLIILNNLASALTLLTIPLYSYLQYEKKAVIFVILSSITVLITLIFSIIGVIVLRQGVYAVIISNLVAQFIYLAMLLTVFFKNVDLRYSISLVKEILKVSLPLIPSFFSMLVIAHSNRFFIQKFCSLDDLGIYTVGSNLGMVMGVVVGAFTTAWFPYYMAYINDLKEAKIIISKVSHYYLVVFGFLTCVFFIFAKSITLIFLDELFRGASVVIGFAAASQFFLGLHSLLLPPLYFSKDVKAVSYIQLITAIFSLLLNYFLIKHFNIVGAGLAIFLSYFCMCIIQYLWNISDAKYIRIRYQWRESGYFLLILLVTIIVSLLDFDLIGNQVFFSIIFALVISYLFYFIFIPRNEWKHFILYIKNTLK